MKSNFSRSIFKKFFKILFKKYLKKVQKKHYSITNICHPSENQGAQAHASLDVCRMTSCQRGIGRRGLHYYSSPHLKKTEPINTIFAMQQRDKCKAVFCLVGLQGYFRLPPWGVDVQRSYELMSKIKEDERP